MLLIDQNLYGSLKIRNSKGNLRCFNRELAIMLYVENINDALAFWQGIGFVGQKIDDNSATIKPAADSQVTLVICQGIHPRSLTRSR